MQEDITLRQLWREISVYATNDYLIEVFYEMVFSDFFLSMIQLAFLPVIHRFLPIYPYLKSLLGSKLIRSHHYGRFDQSGEYNLPFALGDQS